MSYDDFKSSVNALIERAGGNINVRFRTDAETGRHFANFSDGTLITGNTVSKKVSVRWGKAEHGYNHTVAAVAI